ncbi:actin-like ATPase domain-containing protein [Trichodelitschia bisporula]|uniref:Actin-like ATPase domain-containing protein n=1 Tax=Trichodelitschia bisporula TaxID=703511 RepID=A0A6G1HTU3_9PEZI|nr:actin-like ATPase domain-containing protein [Trichodelitschia bisporula]
MASTPSYDVRKSTLSRLRPSTAAGQQLGSLPSPHTPLSRSISGLYGSPAGGYRSEEENLLVFELGSRCMQAGFAGESSPRCSTKYSPDLERRVGDYRRWAIDYEPPHRPLGSGETWGWDHELWRMDIRDLDLGLVEDKVERLVREAELKYFLLDNRTRRVALVVPSSLPKPLLSVLLGGVFNGVQAQTITLLPTAVMATTAAGLRSALVIDIGWEETTATAVYEYREVHQRHSVRAGKALSEEFGTLLHQELRNVTAAAGDVSEDEFTFEEIEEVMTRIGWCRCGAGPEGHGKEIKIPFPTSHYPNTLDVSFDRLSDPAELALFAPEAAEHDLDDHNLPLPLLTYDTLLHLPVDVRRVCMSRIIITGGVSKLPGIKRRLLADLEALIDKRGWTPVRNYGSTKKDPRSLSHPSTAKSAPISYSAIPDDDGTLSNSESNMDREFDPIMRKISQLHMKHSPPPVEGVIRAVESLGAWAGASLVVNNRVRGVVEIERERFLQHGLAGASAAKKDVSVVPQRQSMGPGVRGVSGAAGERGSWGLGVWA